MKTKNDDPEEIIRYQKAQRRQKIALTLLVLVITVLIILVMLGLMLNNAVNDIYGYVG